MRLQKTRPYQTAQKFNKLYVIDLWTANYLAFVSFNTLSGRSWIELVFFQISGKVNPSYIISRILALKHQDYRAGP